MWLSLPEDKSQEHRNVKYYYFKSRSILYAQIKYFKKYHSFGTISKSYNKIVERGKIDTPTGN
jgi:hypothetical protein